MQPMKVLLKRALSLNSFLHFGQISPTFRAGGFSVSGHVAVSQQPSPHVLPFVAAQLLAMHCLAAAHVLHEQFVVLVADPTNTASRPGTPLPEHIRTSTPFLSSSNLPYAVRILMASCYHDSSTIARDLARA